PRQVRPFVDAKGGDPANVARPAAGGMDNSQDDPERLCELRNKLFALERLVSIPAYLSGQVKGSTASGEDTVGVPDRPLPSGGQNHLRHIDVSWRRWRKRRAALLAHSVIRASRCVIPTTQGDVIG